MEVDGNAEVEGLPVLDKLTDVDKEAVGVLVDDNVIVADDEGLTDAELDTECVAVPLTDEVAEELQLPDVLDDNVWVNE